MTIRYVNRGSTAGGDGTTNATTGANRAYATLAEAETALQSVLTEDMNILCTGSTADARTTIDGWTAGSFRIYIKGNPDDTAGAHAGIWNTSKYHISAGSGTLPTLEIIEDSVTVSRIQLTTTNIDGVAIGRFGLIGLAFVADSLVLKGSGITSTSQGVACGDTNNTNVKIKNCIAYDWQTGLYVRQQSAGAGDSFIVNNTVHSCNQGIRGQDNTSAAAFIQCWNNISVANTSDWVDSSSGFDLVNSGHNAYRNTAAACPGSTDIDLSTYIDTDIFVDAANDNFHLLTSGSAYALLDNDGVGPASNVEVTSADIDNDARSGTTTSVGADVITGTAISIPVGTANVTGYAPQSLLTILLPTGTANVTGHAASLAESRLIPQGSLTVAGNALSFITSQAISQGSFVVTGYVPVIVESSPLIIVQEYSLPLSYNVPFNFDAYQPQQDLVSVSLFQTIDIGNSALSLSGVGLSFASAMTIGAGSAQILGHVPQLIDSRIISLPVGTLAISGLAPSLITSGLGIGQGQISFTGRGLSLAQATSIGRVDILAQGLAPTLSVSAPILVNSLIVSGHAPLLQTSPSLINIGLATVALSGNSLTLITGYPAVNIGSSSLSIIGFTPIVEHLLLIRRASGRTDTTHASKRTST